MAKFVTEITEDGVHEKAFIAGFRFENNRLYLNDMDVIAEVEANKREIERLSEEGVAIKAYLRYIFDNFQLKEKERGVVRKAMEMVRKGAETSSVISMLQNGLSSGNLALAAFVLTQGLYKSYTPL